MNNNEDAKKNFEKQYMALLKLKNELSGDHKEVDYVLHMGKDFSKEEK